MVEIMVIIILILSIVLHEVAHGYAANWLGDPTARLAGRLSPNPLLHIDPVGSILIPGMLYFTGAGFLFGWAKPVPYNPYNLHNQKWGESIVAAAGPLSNLLLAVIFAGIVRTAPLLGLTPEFIDMAMTIVSINVLLALFNIIPLPPLDGSKVIIPFLPFGLQQKYRTLAIRLENMGFVALFLMIFVFMMVLHDPFFHLVSFVEKVLIIGL
jgi:Zn-dependent protease